MNDITVVKIWEEVNKKVLSLGQTLEIVGDNFILKDSRGLMCGGFVSIFELYSYLCGFENGFSQGKYLNGNKRK